MDPLSAADWFVDGALLDAAIERERRERAEERAEKDYQRRRKDIELEKWIARYEADRLNDPSVRADLDLIFDTLDNHPNHPDKDLLLSIAEDITEGGYDDHHQARKNLRQILHSPDSAGPGGAGGKKSRRPSPAPAGNGPGGSRTDGYPDGGGGSGGRPGPGRPGGGAGGAGSGGGSGLDGGNPASPGGGCN